MLMLHATNKQQAIEIVREAEMLYRRIYVWAWAHFNCAVDFVANAKTLHNSHDSQKNL